MKPLLHILLLLTGLMIQVATYAQSEKMNVVFIMCDDLNDYQKAFGGHPQAQTPHIDKLAASAVRFTNAQSNVPVCLPSRNSLFTGVYPHNSGDFEWTLMEKQPTLKYNKTIMTLFQVNGYLTMGSGKLTHSHRMEAWDEWGEPYAHNYGPFYFDGKNILPNPGTPELFKSIGFIDGSFGPLSTGGSHQENGGSRMGPGVESNPFTVHKRRKPGFAA